MARPERHDVDYFPFIVKRGKTLNILQSKYGLEGIGFFTNIFRFLAQAPDHYYCISEEDDLMNFFAETGLQDEEKGLEMIELMVKTKKLDRELWENHKVIASEAFLNSLKDAYKNRNNKIITIDEIKSIFQSYPNNPVSYPDNPTEEEKTGQSYLDNPVTYELSPKKRGRNPQTKLKDTKLNKQNRGNLTRETPPGISAAENPELQKACLSVGLSLTTEDTKEISKNLEKTSVDHEFIKYAYLKIQSLDNIKNPLGLLKHVCLNPKKYQSYYLEYKKTSQERTGPDFEKARPPGKCPECGGELKATHNAVMCKKCNTLFEYNCESNSWEKEKVLVKSIFD